MNKAVIVTENSYPEGDAGAVRQHALAKLLLDMNYDVLVIGYGSPTKGNINVYDGVRYISFRENSVNKVKRICDRLVFADKVFNYIKKNYSNLDLLVVVDLMPRGFKKMTKLKKQFGCTLVHDSVEWYSPEEFKKGRLDLAYLRKEYTNLKAINKSWNVIAISKYLEDHFCKKANKVVRIPVIMDVKNIKFRSKVIDNSKIIFSYAGGPGKKDYLKEIIDGFSILNEEELKKIELNIIGVTKKQLVDICNVNKESIIKLDSCLKVHGRVNRNEAVNLIRNSDYSLLIRNENLRYAKAGFPTKIVESLACGTPPLCNYSSDLDVYLKDKYNCIIANGHTSLDVYEAVRKALSISNKVDRQNMRINARKLALQSFDYNVYKDTLNFIC